MTSIIVPSLREGSSCKTTLTKELRANSALQTYNPSHDPKLRFKSNPRRNHRALFQTTQSELNETLKAPRSSSRSKKDDSYNLTYKIPTRTKSRNVSASPIPHPAPEEVFKAYGGNIPNQRSRSTNKNRTQPAALHIESNIGKLLPLMSKKNRERARSRSKAEKRKLSEMNLTYIKNSNRGDISKDLGTTEWLRKEIEKGIKARSTTNQVKKRNNRTTSEIQALYTKLSRFKEKPILQPCVPANPRAQSPYGNTSCLTLVKDKEQKERTKSRKQISDCTMFRTIESNSIKTAKAKEESTLSATGREELIVNNPGTTVRPVPEQPEPVQEKKQNSPKQLKKLPNAIRLNEIRKIIRRKELKTTTQTDEKTIKEKTESPKAIKNSHSKREEERISVVELEKRDSICTKDECDSVIIGSQRSSKAIFPLKSPKSPRIKSKEGRKPKITISPYERKRSPFAEMIDDSICEYLGMSNHNKSSIQTRSDLSSKMRSMKETDVSEGTLSLGNHVKPSLVLAKSIIQINNSLDSSGSFDLFQNLQYILDQ